MNSFGVSVLAFNSYYFELSLAKFSASVLPPAWRTSAAKFLQKPKLAQKKKRHAFYTSFLMPVQPLALLSVFDIDLHRLPKGLHGLSSNL